MHFLFATIQFGGVSNKISSTCISIHIPYIVKNVISFIGNRTSNTSQQPLPYGIAKYNFIFKSPVTKTPNCIFSTDLSNGICCYKTDGKLKEGLAPWTTVIEYEKAP